MEPPQHRQINRLGFTRRATAGRAWCLGAFLQRTTSSSPSNSQTTPTTWRSTPHHSWTMPCVGPLSTGTVAAARFGIIRRLRAAAGRLQALDEAVQGCMVSSFTCASTPRGRT